jgi:hypothetical protein
MTLHLHDGRDEVELFGILVVDAFQTSPAGVDLLVFGQIMNVFDARKMERQRLALSLTLM